MKGFVLFVAIVLGVLVSNVTIGQESSQPTPVVIDGSVSPAPSAPSVTAPAIATTESCCCKQQTLVGMSQRSFALPVATFLPRFAACSSKIRLLQSQAQLH